MHELENRRKKEEADKIKIETAMKVMQSNFVGNMKLCSPDKSEKEIENYCVSAYTDFDDIQSCNTKDEFCYSCCEHEFGVLK